MESIDIKTFTQLKSCSDYKILDIEIINYILNNFEGGDIKKNKKNYQCKKTNQILKNPKIKLIKEKNSNKINLILNKLSENNLQNLLLEFFQNIKILSIEDYNEFIKTIYIKMLNETSWSLHETVDKKYMINFFKNNGVPPNQMIYLKDKQASTNSVRAEFANFLKKAKKGDKLFFYYSGHGYVNDEDKVWLCYWLIFGVYHVVETFFWYILYFIPYFSWIKLGVFGWLLLP
jgi:hypothetical protein